MAPSLKSPPTMVCSHDGTHTHIRAHTHMPTGQADEPRQICWPGVGRGKGERVGEH